MKTGGEPSFLAAEVHYTILILSPHTIIFTDVYRSSCKFQEERSSIAAIRRMLIITAEGAGHVDLVELGLLALIISLLAWSMRLLGARGNSPG